MKMEFRGKTGSFGKPARKEKRKTTELKKKKKMKVRTKFEEFLEMEMGGVGSGAVEDDIERERKLAKKLRVKGGKLGGDDDEMNELIGGIPSILDSTVIGSGVGGDAEKVKEEGAESVFFSRKKKRQKKKASSVSKHQVKQMVEEGDETFEQLDASDEEGPCAEVHALDGKKGLEKKQKTKIEEITEVKESESKKEREEVMPSKKRKKKRKSSRDSMEQPESDADANTSWGTQQESGVSEKIYEREKEPRAIAPSVDTGVKYIAPHLRARASGESEELMQLRHRVRGLLNRLSESNVEPVTEEIAMISRTIARSVGCRIIGEEVIASCSRGPRGNEQYAAIFAAFVAGMACLVGVDFSAKLIASLAKSFEDEFLKEDGLSLRNLTLLISYFFIFCVCSSDLVYDLLSVLSKRLTEIDVSTILTILQCCGMKLRGDDPAAMKEFVHSMQSRVNELKSLSTSKTQELKPKINNKRMEFMLETICDIKNNKKRPKEDPAHYTRLKKWLQKLRAEDIVLHGLTWSKLLDPQKRGQWWLSGEIASSSNVEEVMTTISREVLEAQNLVQLAAAQRMNTDIRRAIFCIIMSAEDYIDAFEKILRLDISGKQDREVMRVLVECCLQEKMFNKYYTVLASKFCSHDKNHKFTLQYCIWDHFKELETMELHRSKNLARFVSEMLSAFTLSLSLLKTVDLADPAQLAPKRIMHFRMLFEAIFDNTDAVVWNIFTRVAAIPELEMLRSSLAFFIKQYVVAANAQNSTLGKFKLAKKALDNVAGVLM